MAMRDVQEILFRGKRVDNGEWVYGYYANCVCTHGSKYRTAHHIIEYPGNPRVDYYEIYTGTVGQYTGLTDKNGTKIFEGDILESRYDDNHPDDSAVEAVVWHDSGWCIKEGKYGPDPIWTEGTLPHSAVIGNVIDNPELMELGGTENARDTQNPS